MSGLYLITGFLGAGKTTFLKQFVQMFKEQRMHIIVNEFGREGIDGELMREMGIALDEINNGSIFCSCRLDKFWEVLTHTLEQSPDVILVEASGLSDPTNVKKILNQKEKYPIFSQIEYMGCICLVDGRQFLKVYETASVVKKQLNVSNLVLLNKMDLVSREQADRVKQVLKEHRPDLPVFETDHGRFQKEWFEVLSAKIPEDEGTLFQTADITLRKYLLHIKEGTDLDRLSRFLNMLLQDTFRIKGFVRTGGKEYQVSAVGNLLEISEYRRTPEKTNLLVVLSGSGMPVKKALKTAVEWYPDLVTDIIDGTAAE